MSRGRQSDAKPGAIDVFVVDCDQSTLMVESRDMITIHPVLQYYDVIARDMLRLRRSPPDRGSLA